MIHRVLDLEELSVREIMLPRHDIVSVPVEATLDQVLETMVLSQHSRLPVWEEAPEHMVGVVFFKDMLRIWHDRRLSIRLGRTPVRISSEPHHAQAAHRAGNQTAAADA